MSNLPDRTGSRARPTPVPRVSAPARVLIDHDEHRMNDEAIAAMARDPDLYVRGGHLVRVIHPEETKTAGMASPVILEVSEATLRERLTLGIRWLRKGKNGKLRSVPPPQASVRAILDRGEWPGMRVITQLVESPMWLPNGEILAAPGHHAGTGLYYSPTHPVSPVVPRNPSKDEARRAAGVLLDMTANFPFARPCHASAWLAALLTPLARFAFRGPTPIFLMDANVPGSGKGLLVDLISIICHGKRQPTNAMPDNGSEFRKLVTTLLFRGSPMVLFDDIGDRLGGGELNNLLTSVEWSDRLLGTNRDVRLPNLTTWFATGNNVGIRGDTMRR
ncbi:hypothetical protein, partial [Zavarzinella formosa]|uniref:hypothetical protein n=1 Tax=Zavarzinella formosa TaxID=360055 RepID=UPI00187D9251